MRNFHISIPQIDIEKDLTIIYKKGESDFHELKTLKDIFYRTLRSFKRKNNENLHSDIIYIQENVEFEIFNKFILSIIDKNIEIKEDEITDFLYLSQKYEYKELSEKIEEIIKEHPELFSFIN